MLVFNIQKYSLHDGSGIRTVVFLKGCPLRCRWCCNPESQSTEKELMYRKGRCIGKERCGLCAGCAPEGCLTFDREGKAKIDFSKVRHETEWAGICPAGALTVEGREITIREILDTVERDAVFYRDGKGGLTVSGGEPLLQENTVCLLREARERYIHTAIETCGYAERGRLLEAARYLDEIFFDIKSLNDRKHREYTGAENRMIRENLRALCAAFPEKKITVRTPVIPGFNDSDEELGRIAEFLEQFPQVAWQKLPYHTYGVQKYEMLGRKYSLNGVETQENGGKKDGGSCVSV